MINFKEVKTGNFLNLYTDSQNPELVKVSIVEEKKINGIEIENYEPILLNNEWFIRLNAIPNQEANLQIGKLRFKRTEIALVYCNENYEPIPGKRLVSYVHQLQNTYLEKTGEELIIQL